MRNPLGVFKKDRVLGLDIGFVSVKLAQFVQKEGGLHLSKVAMEEFEPGMDQAFPEQELRAALKKILKGVDIERSRIAVCLNCPDTYVRTITTPAMPDRELEKAVRLEVKNYFPALSGETELDLEVMGETLETGSKQLEVLVAASPRATVLRYLSVLSAVGVKPALLIPVGVALRNLVQKSQPRKEDNRVFLEVGGRFSETTIFQGTRLILSRKIPIAGADLTKSMTVQLTSSRGTTQLSLKQAEKLKREIGIPPEGEDRVLNGNVSTGQILAMLRVPLQRLVDEVSRSLDFYREEHHASSVDSLILLGGGASLKGLAPFLSRELGISVELEDSFGGLNQESHRLALAIGAAMNAPDGVNLLPDEVRNQTRHTLQNALWESALAALLFVSFFVFTGMKIELDNFHKRITVAQGELQSLGAELELIRDQNFVKRSLSTVPYWEDVFKELSNVVPLSVTLTELKVDAGSLLLKGVVVSPEKERVLSDFILAMEKGIFKNAQLVSSKEIQGTAGKNEFEIKCGFD
jgi:type IV pilus assembly protein PilM